MLEYDNSAFYYFALTLLAIYVLPGTYFAVTEFFAAIFGSGEVGAKARTSLEKDKAAKLKKATTGWARLNTTKYLANLVGIVIAWILVIYLVNLVKNDGEVSSFDPYQILGVQQDAAVAEIKKAYRKLSLKYHPDKNIGNKLAEEMFLKVAKAYEALTDETSKENYKKYGNPDGKQALEVSIGLPKLLLDNPKVVLVLYLVFMVIVIPSVVAVWYSNSKQFGEKNVLYDTYNAFYQLIQENYTIRNLPEIIAASSEFRAVNEPKQSDIEPMSKLYETMKNEKLMLKPKFEQPKILRGNLLLHAHMHRMTKDLNEPLVKDLNAMLTKTPDLIDGLVEIGQLRKWFDVSIASIKLHQCVVQALSHNADPFAQLPYLTEDDIKKLKAHYTKTNKAFNFISYLKLSDDEKRAGLEALSLKGLVDSKEKLQDFLTIAKLLPRNTIETKLFVEEEVQDFLEGVEEKKPSDTIVASGNDVPGDMIYEQDLVTLRVTIRREHFLKSDDKKNKKSKGSLLPVHAPFFPNTVYENIWIVLKDKATNANSKKGGEGPLIHAFEKIPSDATISADNPSVVNHEIKFYAPQREGKYELELFVYSDAYMGVDEVIPISYIVHPAASLPEYVPHPEDLELDNEPTVFEQLMASNNLDDSSDEEEEPEEDPYMVDESRDEGLQMNKMPKKPVAASAAPSNSSSGNTKSKGKKKATRVVEEVDADSD